MAQWLNFSFCVNSDHQNQIPALIAYFTLHAFLNHVLGVVFPLGQS